MADRSAPALDAKERLYCAVDTADLEDALLLADLLAGEVGGFKFGNAFFTAHGPEGVRRVAAGGLGVFLDLKFHDIPSTVAGAVGAAASSGCAMLTVHASGGGAMLRAAVDAAARADGEAPLVLAVTVLTSLDDEDLHEIGQPPPLRDQVVRLALLAMRCGVGGMVCSPLEIQALRAELGPSMRLVVPGIRPVWTSVDDQKRVLSPREALEAGADILVIGRPITGADDPVAAARRIVAEIDRR